MEMTDEFWIYGRHAVEAALNNPKRQKHRLVTISEKKKPLDLPQKLDVKILNIGELENLLPAGAVHQGIALLASPLTNPSIDQLIKNGENESVIVVLDQANNSGNIGAILRSAWAFGVDAVIVQSRNAPDANSSLTKSASGALENIPLIRVPNIVNTLNKLKGANYWCVGMDNNAKQSLHEIDLTGKVVLVLGSEESGLRRLVRENCDFLASIRINSKLDSLNISATAAIALYELCRR